MKLSELKINGEIEYFGRTYIVLEINPPNVVIKRVEGDYETITVNFYDLVLNPSFKAGKRLENELKKETKRYISNLDNLSDKKRDVVSKRYELIKPAIVLEKAKGGDMKAYYHFYENYKEYIKEKEDIVTISQKDIVKRIAEKHGISIPTLYRYLYSYKQEEYQFENSGLEGLIPKHGHGQFNRKDNKKLVICHPKKPDLVLDTLDVRVETQYIDILKKCIEQEYLTSRSISKRAIYEYVKIECTIKNLEPLKEITIYKILDRIDAQVRSRMRDGKKASEKYDSIERGFSNEEAFYPLHLVEIDHTELDLEVIDDVTGYEIGRPWITLGIDVFSRMIWCMYISFEPPSANKVRKAIQHGLFFKKVKEKYGTFNEWDIFGVPSIIQLDNGPDFKSQAVKRMINETLQSNVRYRPVRTPKYGATIERLFATINSELIHRLAGTTKSSFTKLGDYNPTEEAMFTLSDITEILTKYITDIYHYDVHKGLPLDSCTPMVRYLEGIQKTGFPEFIDTDSEEGMKIELLPTTYRPYTRDGIRLDNVLYASPELSNFIAGRNIKYKIKYDIDDISKIYFFNQETSEYIEVPAVTPSAETLKNVNKYTYEKLLKIYKNEGIVMAQSLPGTSNIEKAKVKLQQDIKEKYKKSRTIRQQAERMRLTTDIFKNITTRNNKKDLKLEDLLTAAKAVEKVGAEK